MAPLATLWLTASLTSVACLQSLQPVLPIRKIRFSRLSAQMTTKAEAQRVISLATKRIARDKTVKNELGRLVKVQNVLGFGSPRPGVIAVSFNASFKRAGTPFFTLTGEKMQSDRGTSVGKVSARLESGRLSSVVIAKDGGWGKSINVAL